MRVQAITVEEALPLRQQVLRPHLPPRESHYFGDTHPVAGHFGVFDGDVLVSVGTVHVEACKDLRADEGMKSPSAWRLRGMATHPSARSKGCGGMVLKACLEHAKSHGASVVWCNARTGASVFYDRHGFQKMSGEYDMPSIGPHYLMKTVL